MNEPSPNSKCFCCGKKATSYSDVIREPVCGEAFSLLVITDNRLNFFDKKGYMPETAENPKDKYYGDEGGGDDYEDIY